MASSAAGRTALLVCDVQAAFAKRVRHFDRVVRVSCALMHAARILGMSVTLTEQYPKGLGYSVPAVWEAFLAHRAAHPALAHYATKTRFSMATSLPPLPSVDTFIVTGLEAHVCVQQTVRDLLASPAPTTNVVLAVDGVASQRALDCDVALRHMARLACASSSSSSTAVGKSVCLSTSESIIFDLLEDKSHEHFRAISALFREFGSDVVQAEQ